jgi:hypothetical protein
MRKAWEPQTAMDPEPQVVPGEGGSHDPEHFWAEILSEDPVQIGSAFDRLAPGERLRVLEHLRRMARDDGWQPGQRRRARTALDQLEKQSSPADPEES